MNDDDLNDDDWIRDVSGKAAMVIDKGVSCPGCGSRGYGNEKHLVFKTEANQIRVYTCGYCSRKFKVYQPLSDDF